MGYTPIYEGTKRKHNYQRDPNLVDWIHHVGGVSLCMAELSGMIRTFIRLPPSVIGFVGPNGHHHLDHFYM